MLIVVLFCFIHLASSCASKEDIKVNLDEPVRGKMRFAFLENCRVYLGQQMQELNLYYKTRNENGVWTNFGRSNAEYTRFNENGNLECFKRGKLIYLAEVPCDTVNDGSFSFTLGMCNQDLNYDNCINMYSEIMNPSPKTYIECMIGSICYRKFDELYYPLKSKCGPIFAGYEIIPSMYYVDGEFKSPDLMEFSADFKSRKNSTYYNVSTTSDEDSDDPNNFWKKRSVNHTYVP